MELEKGFVLIPFAEITLGRHIGSGAYGTVVEALRSDGSRVAVKKMRLGDRTQRVQDECRLLSRAKHENIISMYGYTMPDNEQLYLIMEYLEGGTLSNLLHNSEEIEYTIKDVINWFLQITKAVAFLHALGPRPIIHRDLKPANMLLSNNRRTLKICDFGTVREVATQMSSMSGTPQYIAREVLAGNRYTEKCDVWSCAITLWEMFARQRPYAEFETSISLMFAAYSGFQRPTTARYYIRPPEEIRTVLVQAWNQEPEDRPTMAEMKESFESFAIDYGLDSDLKK